ncbi:hypothetical protein V4891_04955, partial [Ralstonia solanacearum species complex bacterium KE055]
NRLDCLLPHYLQGLVFDRPSIRVSFAFHANIVSHDITFQKVSTCEVAVAEHVQGPLRAACAAINQIDTVLGANSKWGKAPFQCTVTAF